MEQGIQLLYKQRYPEISEAEDVFAVLEQHSRWRKDETLATSQKIIKIAVTISLEKRKAEKLLQNPYLRVGLSRARMERRINVSRCRRCWGYSHSENRCTGPDRRKLCFKCGKGDHIAKECTATTNTCLVCDKEHRLGTAGCDSFRKALSRLRKEALRPPWIGATSSDANEAN
ncbi:hypothetical protein HUJ04_012864 [Dendroctonus ponderosae]|nr:hypothetical protein HUJ04_012864 [Dendroctonus ponderosae]